MEDNRKPQVTVLGSGHSGHALAASFSRKGYPVTLVSLSRRRRGLLPPLVENQMVLTENQKTSSHPIRYSSDIQQAARGAKIVLCTVPAFHHADLIERLLPHLESGQYVYFSSYFGAMRMRERLQTVSHLTDVTIVESMSAIHAARSQNYGEVEILAGKDEIPVAAYPTYKTKVFIDLVKEALPNLSAANNILMTSLNNVGPILHVPLMLFSAARIESTAGEGWNLYHEGLTFAVENYIKQLDSERVMIANQLDIAAFNIEHIMLNIFYKEKSAGADNFWQWIRHNDIHASKTVGTPAGINTRYLTEGVHYGLKSLSHLARDLGLATPTIDSTITLSETLLKAFEPQEQQTFCHLSPPLVYQIKSFARAA